MSSPPRGLQGPHHGEEAGTHDGGVQLAGGAGAFAAGVAFVAQERLASDAPAAGKQFTAHRARHVWARRAWAHAGSHPGRRSRAVELPEKAGVRGAGPVGGGA